MANVLHIIDSLGLGGAQTVVKGIFEGQKENKNIFLYSLRTRDINIDIEHNNIFGYSSSSKFSLFPILELKSFIKRNKIDVLHCHLAKSQIFGGIIKILFFPRLKLIFHEHGQMLQNGRIYPFIINSLKSSVNLYIAVSKVARKSIISKTSFTKDKILLLYNFVDLDTFKVLEDFSIKDVRQKHGLQMDEYVVGFAARLVEAKGWKEFIGSAKLLVEQGIKIKFIIGGDGKDKEKIAHYIENHNLSANILLIGHIDNMVTFYNMIDLFVFPSHKESMGLTGLEANACGTPVIASNINGINEIMINNENCLLFKVKDINNLTKVILQIYNDNILINHLIRGGLNNVKSYSLINYITNLNKNYD